MKILIGYDGSACANAALDDLLRAGLPPLAEARIVAVSEVVLPPPMSYTLPSAGALELQRLLEHHALETAETARRKLQNDFPGWTIGVEAHPGSPASTIITVADEWLPDLIVLGSHGRTALGRFVLGSVSHAVLGEARCSVRIVRHPTARTRDSSIIRLVVGVDGSPISDAAVQSIASRRWPPDTEVCVLHADYAIPPVGSSHVITTIANWIAEERQRISRAVDAALTLLRNAGLEVRSVVRPGDARQMLVEEAASFEADAIFIGARNLSRGGRLRLGSVSSAVVAQAACTVEVVRIGR